MCTRRAKVDDIHEHATFVRDEYYISEQFIRVCMKYPNIEQYNTRFISRARRTRAPSGGDGAAFDYNNIHCGDKKICSLFLFHPSPTLTTHPDRREEGHIAFGFGRAQSKKNKTKPKIKNTPTIFTADFPRRPAKLNVSGP